MNPAAPVRPLPHPDARPDDAVALTRWLVACLGRCEDEQRADAIRQELVLANLLLAQRIARRYQRRGIAAEDLRQVAHAGLVGAAERFDPARDTDFPSYAGAVVRGSLRWHFAERGLVLRTSPGDLDHDLLDPADGRSSPPPAAPYPAPRARRGWDQRVRDNLAAWEVAARGRVRRVRGTRRILTRLADALGRRRGAD